MKETAVARSPARRYESAKRHELAFRSLLCDRGAEFDLKEYLGPTTSEDHAVEQARTVFKKTVDDHLVQVEAVDREAWGEDTVYLPPDGDKGVAL